MALYRAALSTAPDYAEAHANLGHELLKAGHLDQALTHLTRSLALNPNLAGAQGDLGLLLAARGQFDQARLHIERALSIAPATADNGATSASCSPTWAPEEAIAHCNAALRIDPSLANARFNLTNAMAARAGAH